MASVLPPLENMAARRGGRDGRRIATVDPSGARAYAAATNDSNPAYEDGRYAPPVYGVVPTWDVLRGAVEELVPAEAAPMLLHAEQDMRFHRALVPGLQLSTEAETYSVRASRSGTWLTLRATSTDPYGTLVLEQFSTMFVRGMTGLAESGPDRPGHRFPDAAREHPVAQVTRRVDPDQTFRYRDASGDDNPIHVDEEFARRAKLPGIILHGLCTMAMCGSVVVDQVAGRDPARLARLAVRFSRPVLPGNDLVVSLFAADATPKSDGSRSVYAFEAASGGKTVVRDGLTEVRS